MRIVLLANSWVGLQIAQYFKSRNEHIVALCIHEPEKQKNIKEIIKASGVPRKNIFLAHMLRDPQTIERLRKLQPDIGISAFWGYILKPSFLELFPKGCINFHPGFLPTNRGMNPNVWPFVEETQAGVTLHYIDNGIDTGPIIARKEVRIEPIDTAGSIYDKTLIEIVTLFKKSWPKIKKGTLRKRPQSAFPQVPTFHRAVDVNTLDLIDLDLPTTARAVIARLRARSYAHRYFSYYEEKGKRVYIRLDLSYRPV